MSGSGLGRRLFEQHDANFDATALTNTSGVVVQRSVYGPYGTIRVLSPSWASATDAYSFDPGFQGMWRDPVTGLYYTPNRDYDPATGTWRELDPAGYVNGADAYQLVDSNPAILVDPFGTDANDARALIWQASRADYGHTSAPTSQPATDEGYTENGGHDLAKAAIISSLKITSDGDYGGSAVVALKKGPEADVVDGGEREFKVNFLRLLSGENGRDIDSAQVVVGWRTAKGKCEGATNAIADGTTGATWNWDDPAKDDEAYVRLPIGKDAVEVSVLVVYTDVVQGPNDAPSIVASWSAKRANNVWQITARTGDIGIGHNYANGADVNQAEVDDVTRLIQARTNNYFTLKPRPGSASIYDSGFDVVRNVP